MRAAHVVEIVTPKKVILNGLWFGPTNAARTIIWLHGLSSTVFSKHGLMEKLTDGNTAVLTFNNRGHGKVSRIPTTNGKRICGGAAHEIFKDCVDDIEGAIAYAKGRGARSIILAGHSTGCQKSVYWAAKKGKGVDGIVLLAPISDYSATVMLDGKKKIARAMSLAKGLIKKNRPHELLPESVWDWSLLADAQRFVSLYSGVSEEEIFTYWDPSRTPKALHAVKVPLLVVLGQNDEYADRPAEDIAAWFALHLKPTSAITIIPNTDHSFEGAERLIAARFKKWIRDSMKTTS